MNKKDENNPKSQRIQVFARCRPLNNIEKKQNSPSVVEVIPDKKIVVKDRNANREFLFDKVFPTDTKQISVYKAVVGPLIQEVLMGYNCTVFAYGQTGTGKTYTMEGERNDSKCSWEDDPGAGIIPRSLHQLFEDLTKEENVEFSVRVSFLELYNEELFDLLSSTELSRLRLYEDPAKKGSVIIQGLEEIMVNSKDEVYSILERGTARRQTAATMLNATSSRSHTVFSVTVHIKENTIEGEELLKTGKLNLVDLAGSENVGRSGAVDKRAREAGNINQSLLTLGRVITALIEKQPHVPYRESKLTRLLQDSLGGHTKTSIIATISPAHCNFDETISTLDYATKAKSITIKPEVNQKMTKRALIREYTEEIERLRKDLLALRSSEGFYIHRDNYTELMNEGTKRENLIQDLTRKIEELKEENTKIEDMFKVTREELTMTCEKLNETSQKYKETASQLSNTTDVLSHTQKILSETTLQRDEKEFLINIHCNTERKLSEQARKLLHVADETTNDVEKLHAKIDRKATVEKTNEEKCKEFREIYHEQFAMLDKLVSESEKQQVANLLRTKENIDNVFQCLLSHHTKASEFLNNFFSGMISKMKNVSASLTLKVDSQKKWTNSFLGELDSKKEELSKKQNIFLSDELPKFIIEMNAKNSLIEEWICDVYKQMSEKIEMEKHVLCERSDKRKELQSIVKESLELLCSSYDNIIKDFTTQSEVISSIENKFEKDFEEKLNDLKKTVVFFEEFAEHRKELKKTISQRDNLLMTGIKQNALKFEEIHQPLMKLYNSEYSVEEDKENLNKVLAIMNIDEFSERQNLLSQSQKKVAKEFENFTKENKKEEEILLLEVESSVKSHLSTISQNAQSLHESVAEINLFIEDYVQLEKASVEENRGEVQKFVDKANNNINQSQEFLQSVGNNLKDTIQKMDSEFKNIIPDGLLKDIPTGTTPQRKTYTYPRLLAATSPHDRLIERYHSKLAADTAIAVTLPLNSSFSQIEEDTVPLKGTDVINVNNESLSSDDSTSWDTDASSVSDASRDRKNKENCKNSKKRSRLPKRLPRKEFLKNPLPSMKRPLSVSNSADCESFKEDP